MDQGDTMNLLKKDESDDKNTLLDYSLPDRTKTRQIQRTFVQLKAGQALVFTPFCCHGSESNTTDDARIALNFRFQSQLKPLYIKSSEYFTTYNLGSAHD